MSEKTTLNDLKIDTIRKGTVKYRIKSYIYFMLLLLIVFIVFILLGGIGNDFFGLIIFLIVMLMPVLLLFRNKMPSVLPDFIANSVYEIDNRPETELAPYQISQRNKEYAMIFSIVILIIGSIVLIADYRNNIGDKMCIFKIMGSVICLIVSGIMVGEFSGEDLYLGSKEQDEAADKNMRDVDRSFAQQDSNPISGPQV
jgi:hypothetical protein